MTLTRSLCLPASCLFAVIAGPALAAVPVDFRRDVLPILSANCFACHGPDAGERQADLRLDDPSVALAELPSGNRAIVTESADRSALVQRITAADPLDRMPPPDSRKSLTNDQIKLLVAWIEQGAAYQDHWAYEPIVRPDVPDTTPWTRNAIDAFIHRRLREEGQQPSPEADRVTLLRRLSFDLTGLPPDYADVKSFSLDNRPDAYERLVGDLLASPHYGERMAIYWLDLVRYADSVGYHGDQEISVSPFRDYVIEAFNANMPFDQFTREQLGGDLLPESTDDQLIASGYNRLGMMSAEGGVQPKEYLAKYAAERVRNASLVWLGSTLGCAECHDHKYDPFTSKDFYAFASFFADIKEQGIYSGANASGAWGPKIELPTPEQEEKLAELDQQISLLESKTAEGQESKPATEGETDDAEANADQQLKQLKDQLEKLRKERDAVKSTILTSHITVAVEPREMRVLPRGNWMDDSGEVVEPTVPHFLRQIKKDGRATRLDLAEWLVADDNALTARVFVNRLWYLYFGRGLVSSLGDFGTQGTPPSHPELLDWLAAEFVESGWDVKHMVRLIVTSATYRQSSMADADARTADPYNELLARQGRHRLNAEMIRDNALTVSGLLVREMGGRSAKPYQPAGYYAHLNFPMREYEPSQGEELWRRSVYTHWQRQFLHPSLLAFDAPTREECSVQRPRSNTPLAALVLLNDPIYIEAARGLAERILREASADPTERIRFAYRTALSRGPREAEIALLAGIVADHLAQFESDPDAAAALLDVGARLIPEDLSPSELAAWTSVARILINSHEFITRN